MTSENFVVVREEAQNSVAIVDLKSRASPTRLPIAVDGAVMNPVSKVVAMRAQNQLTLFSLDMKAKIKQSTFSHQVQFWRWIDQKTVGIVTTDAVYHWSLEGQNEPTKIFDRTPYTAGPVQIINYQVSADGKWCILNGLSVDQEKNFNGVLQVYSVDANASQPTLNASAATFVNTTLDNQSTPANLFCFALKEGTGYTLKILQLGVPKQNAFTQIGQMRFQDRDFPMSMTADPKLGIVYVLSQAGFLFAYEVQSGKPIYASRVSPQTVFTTAQHSEDGIVAIDLQGTVMQMSIDREKCVPYICNQMNDMELGTAMARRYGLGGADHLFKAQFQQLMQQGRIEEAGDLAASSPNGILRTTETLNQLKAVSPQALIGYFQRILNKGGQLNAIESVELAVPLLAKGQTGIDHITNWLKESKLEASEKLGDELRQHNAQLALSVYLRADAKEKVCMSFAQLGASESSQEKAQEMFLNVLKFAKQKSYSPNYSVLLQAVVRFNSDRAKDFALLLVSHEDGPKMDIGTVTDLFINVGDVKSSTNIFLEYFRGRGDRAEDGYLQTRLFESNLQFAPQVANALFESEDFKFTHYDRIRIAQMCEQSQLYQRALEHYTEPSDIKRVLLHANQMKPEFLADFFGKVQPTLGLECLRDLLRQNLQQNIRLVVEVAKQWTEHYGAETLISLFEEFNSFNGLYFFLASFVNFTTNPTVVYKYIEAGIRVGAQAVKEVERVCRENDVYDSKQIKDFLLEHKFTLTDPRPLITVCDKHGYIEELVGFLYNNNLLQFIEAYVQRKSPKSAPDVLGALIDLNASQASVVKILEGLRSPADDSEWVLRLSDVFEKRNRLAILRNWLEARSQEGSSDSHVYTALAKLYIDGSINARNYLETNSKYNTLLVGKFCEQRDPTLAVVVYRKGKNDRELIDVTTSNGFFKEQARYLVERQSLEAWAMVLANDTPSRRSVVDQVVSTALPESHSAEEVSCAVKAFMNADLMKELIELLERLMLHSTEHNNFKENHKLQNLLILTAIKVDPKRVLEYVRRLDNYDVDKIALVCGSEPHKLYEEAFFIFKKAKKHTQAVQVLLNNIKDFTRAVEYANYSELPEVWVVVGKAQLDNGLLVDSIKSFLKGEDAQYYKELVTAVTLQNQQQPNKEGGEVKQLYTDLITFLKMARKKSKDAFIDNELIYCYAKTDKLADLEDFVNTTTTAKLIECGDRCFAEGLYQASKIIFAQIQNHPKLAKALVKLGQWSEAVEAAKKAKSIETWKFVCFSCCESKEFKLAQICGLNIIGIMEHLTQLIAVYESYGYFSELITLLEAGINLERTHQGIFTALGVMYARHREEKLMEHLKLFSSRSNIPQLIKVCRENLLWSECVFLTSQYEQFDQALEIMISPQGSATAWKHETCKELLLKCTNVETIYMCIEFYYQQHPLLLTDVLIESEKKIDATRVVFKLRQWNTANNIDNNTSYALIIKYLLHIQHNDVAIVNDTIHEVFIDEGNHAALRQSIEEYKQFDHIGLAQKLENHEVLEFRRVAVFLYKQNQRYEKSIEVAKRDKLYQDMMSTCAAANKQSLTIELLQFFVQEKLYECFSAMLYTCYHVIPSDIVLELAWRHNLQSLVMPYMIQTFSSMNTKMLSLEAKVQELERSTKQTAEKVEKESDANQIQQDAIGLGLIPNAHAPQTLMIGYSGPMNTMNMNNQMGAGNNPNMNHNNGW
jgi:clathrin heavy chain